MPPRGGKSSDIWGRLPPFLKPGIGAPASDDKLGFELPLCSFSFSFALLSRSRKCCLLFCVKMSAPPGLAPLAAGDVADGLEAAVGVLGFNEPSLKTIFLSRFST